MNNEEIIENLKISVKDILENLEQEIKENILSEERRVIRITSKGERIKKIKCPKGKVLKNINGRQVCVTQTGKERMDKKRAIKKSVRTKKAKGSGFKKRVSFRRNKAIKKRKMMGVK